ADLAPRRHVEIDAVHFVDQALVDRGQPNDRRFTTARPEYPHQPLEQPRPERIEALDPRHVDADAADFAAIVRLRLDQGFEVARPLRRPGAGAGQFQAVAFGS